MNSSKCNSFFIYPNPLRAEIYIDRASEKSIVSCSVFNLEGHLILENKNLSNKNTISFSEFPSGTYTIKVQDGNETVIKNFLKL